MDCRPTLEILARLLPVVPNLEDQLVTFDSLVGVSEREHRADAARMLRDAAAGCADEARRERLREAAGAVEAGRPCAFTPEGLSAREAAAQQTITLEEWERRGGDASLPPPPAASVEMEEEDDEDEEADREEEDFLPDAPPALPHLPVRHFFPGLILRVAQAFRDAQGRELQPGERLHLLG